MKAKRGYLLVNLGSPDSPSVSDVRRYLDEFLMDPYVIDKPYLLRAFLVRGLILRRRPAQSSEAYQSIWTEEGSPLVVHSKALVQALSDKGLENAVLAMRYGSPSIGSVCERLLQDVPDLEELVLLPLYPQYAMSTTRTCIESVRRTLRKLSYKGSLIIKDPFYAHPDYLQVLSDDIAKQLPDQWEHLLFSFHGLPERHLRKTDPTAKVCMKSEDCCDTACESVQNVCYRYQCLQTMHQVAKLLGISSDQYSVSFQSRLGRDPWIEPFTDDVLTQFPDRGIRHLAVVCPAFVSDCLETLEEIEMEGAQTFLSSGGESFKYIKCLNENTDWVNFLFEWLRER